MKKIILGTRSSKMAGIVANKARDMLESVHTGFQVDIQQFKSFGDRFQGDLKSRGGKGAFVNDLERRLLTKEIDCAIHAVKDIPADTTPNPDLKLFSFLPREDVRDALIVKQGKETPKQGTDCSGFTFGTSSPRRACILKNLYPGCDIKPLRGNADTRLKKLENEDYDAIVLSHAGLKYLDMQDVVSHVFDPEEMLPAVGQGALVIQVRSEDAQKCTFLREINSEEAEASVNAERSMLKTLQGNCHSAIAGYYRKENGNAVMEGLVGSEKTGKIIRVQQDFETNDPIDHGIIMANSLIKAGADKYI